MGIYYLHRQKKNIPASTTGIGSVTGLGSLPTGSDLSQSSPNKYIGVTDPKLRHKLMDDDAHHATIKVAQQSRQANGEPPQKNPLDPPKEPRSIMEDVSQALYLPAINEGFNDLVTKPYAGAADFFSRTIDKAYHSITGENAPNWLVGPADHDDLLHRIVQGYDDAYTKRDKPTNIASGVAEGVVGSLPLVASLFTGEGEVSLATKLPNLFSKTAKVLGTTGALNAYHDATKEDKGDAESLKDAAKGGVEGVKTGLELDAMMLAGGWGSKGAANYLAEKGLLKGGKVAEKILHAIATGTVFSGASVGNDLLQGKDIDGNEAAKQFGMGFTFEAIPVTKALHDELSTRSDNKKIDAKAAQSAVAATAASNMNSEGMMRTLMETPLEHLVGINDNIQETHGELYGKSIESGMKAYDATDPNEKRTAYANQLLLKTQGDVKNISAQLADPAKRTEITNDIVNSDELTDDHKAELLQKIDALTPKTDEKVEPIIPNEPVKEPKPVTKKQDKPVEKVDEKPKDIVSDSDKANYGVNTAKPAIELSKETGISNDEAEQKVNKAFNDVAGTIDDGIAKGLSEDDIWKSVENNFTEGDLKGSRQATVDGIKQFISDKVGGNTDFTAKDIYGSEEKAKESTQEDDKVRQKAIDAITHGVIVPENMIEGDTAGRFDLGMTSAEKKKAVKDITNGNYNTAPAKKLLQKVIDWEKSGEYPIIDGTGGASVRNRAATSEEIQQNIDDAKAFKAQKLTDQQSVDFNKEAKEHGLTEEDFDNYENYRNDPTGEQSSLGRDAKSIKDKVQQPEDDKPAGEPQDTGGEKPQNESREIIPEKPTDQDALKKERDDIVKQLDDADSDPKKYIPESSRKKLEERLGQIQRELNKPKQSGGVVMLPYTAEFIEHDVLPTLQKIGGTFKGGLKWLVNSLSPKTGVSGKALDTITTNLNSRNEAAAALDKAIGQIEKLFDKMPDQKRIDFINRIKRGHKQPTAELQDIADAYKEMDKQLYDEIAKHKGSLPFKEDHFRVLWKELPGSETRPTNKRSWFGASRRPLEGSKGFFKRATLADMSEGIARGGEPVSTNPMTMFKLAHADAMKFITASRMFDALKEDGFVKFVKTGADAPEGYVKIKDKIANVYFPVKEGMVKTGEYYIEENAGRLVNNHLSVDHIRDGAVGRGLMEIKNLYTAAELGLSGYHASAIALEGISSDIGRGLRKMVNLGLRGDLGAAGSGIMDILKSPFSPKTTFSLGRSTIKLATVKDFENSDFGKKFLKANPEAGQYIHDFFMGGGLMNQSADLKANAFKALKEQAGKDNYIGAALRAIPALNEMVMSPLFDHYIPAMKVGMFMKEFPLTLAENEGRLKSGKVTREALARKTVNFIDDRLGEMNFDNLFWDRTFKTSMQLMLRSVTWKLGNLRAMGGAPIEQAQEFYNAAKEKRAPLLEPKMAWVLGLATMQVALSTVTQYMFTGTYPQKVKDLIAPRIDNNDDKQRIILPTYVKDVMHLVKKGPVDYVTSSLAGDVGKLADVWSNSDFQRYNIYDPHESLWQNTKDITGYVMPEPISVSNLKKSIKQGDKPSEMAMSFFGLNKAPKYLTEPAIENKIFDLYSLHVEHTRSKGQKEEDEAKKQIKELYKRGKGEDAEKLANEYIKDGTIRQTQFNYLRGHLHSKDTPGLFFFQKLPTDDKVYLYEQMTPEERKVYDPHGKIRSVAEKKEKAKEKKDKPFSILK